MKAQATKGLAIAALSIGAAVCGSRDASAQEHLLLAEGEYTGTCPDASGNSYFVEGRGYDQFGDIVCETTAIAGSTIAVNAGQCVPLLSPFGPAITHQAFITTRTQSFQWVSNLQQSALTNWGSSSPVIEYQAPQVNSGCSGGTVIAISLGTDTTSN